MARMTACVARCRHEPVSRAAAKIQLSIERMTSAPCSSEDNRRNASSNAMALSVMMSATRREGGLARLPCGGWLSLWAQVSAHADRGQSIGPQLSVRPCGIQE